MNKKEILTFIENELKNYKKNISVLNSIILENDIELPSTALKEVYYSRTNKFSSITENMALNNKLEELEKEIKRVENWLNRLNERESFVIKNIYLENKSYNSIAQNWHLANNYYLSITTLKRIKNTALDKIYVVFTASFFNQ